MGQGGVWHQTDSNYKTSVDTRFDFISQVICNLGNLASTPPAELFPQSSVSINSVPVLQCSSDCTATEFSAWKLFPQNPVHSFIQNHFTFFGTRSNTLNIEKLSSVSV